MVDILQRKICKRACLLSDFLRIFLQMFLSASALLVFGVRGEPHRVKRCFATWREDRYVASAVQANRQHVHVHT